MSYEVFLEKKAIKDIRKIPEKERDRVKQDIRALRDFPEHLDIKKLSVVFTLNVLKYRK